MLKINSGHRLKRFPSWLRQSVRTDAGVAETKGLLRELNINTVCQDARCPNIYDCFSRKKCTFLILGNSCTRSCGFCAIETRRDPALPDKEELFNIKEAVRRLGAKEIVITSVTRDDLDDGGAGHFADCIRGLRQADAGLGIEVLVPDFLGKADPIEKVVFAGPDIFSHNIETVPRLYNKVRPQAAYQRSLDVIRYAKGLDRGILTKSGLMAGLGETRQEVREVMQDLRDAGCDIITIGQYLRPVPRCLEVKEFLHPDEFNRFSTWAEEIGFTRSECSPFTRSSYA
ncbi:MAG: lipoyl synthase [Actinobacteria bacterium]|nr:lipoyl synthase [Actinomycetota bacterium]